MKRFTLLKYLCVLAVVGFYSLINVNAQTVDATGTFDIPVTGDTLLYASVSITDVNTNGTTDVTFTLSEPEISAWTDYSVAVRFAGSQIDVRDGGGFATPVNVVPIEFDTRYHIWIALDVASMSYTTWVKTDAMAKPVLIYQDASFRNLVDTIYHWSSIHNPGGEPDILVVDTVKSVPENYAIDLPGGSDGSASNIRIPALQTYITGYPYTVEMWIKPSQWTSYGGFWVSRDASNGNATALQYDNNSDMHLRVDVEGTGRAVNLNAAIPVLNKWHHTAVVVRSDSIKVILDGVVHKAVNNSAFTNAFGYFTYLGYDTAVLNRTLTGLIDEVRFWNVERTEQEIEDYKYSELQGNETGLVDYFSLDDLAAVATDVTGNGLDGIIHGATYIPSFDVTNATLSHVSLDAGSITFDPYTTDYNVLVPYGTTTVNVTATATEYGTVITGDGAVDVSSGSGTATVVVTALDGTTQMTYTIDITVDNPLDDAYLIGLDVSAGALNPVFHSDTLAYDLIVPNGAASVDLTATASYSGATVTGDGAIALTNGSAIAKIVVTSADASTSKTYTVNVVEADGKNYAMYFPGGDGNNSNIDISGLGVDTLPYTIEMWIKPEVEQVFNGGLFYSRDGSKNAGIMWASNWQQGYPTYPYKLRLITNSGDYGVVGGGVTSNIWNHIAVVVTDTSRTFYVNGNPIYERIDLSDYDFSSGRLYLGWDSDVDARAFKGVIDEVRVWNVYKDSATIANNKYDELNGDELGLAGYWNFNLRNTSQAVDLTSNKLHGVITGGTYVPSFDPTDASLSGITLSVGALNPSFNPDTLVYNTVLPAGTDTVFVSALTSNPLANMVITDTVVVTSGSGTATIDVTAFDGITENNYVINFIVSDGSFTLKHSYTFEDGTAADVVGGADGTLNGGEIVDGIYTADTDGEYIDLPASAININTYPAITLEMYLTAGTSNGANVMTSYFGNTTIENKGTDYFFNSHKSRAAISCLNTSAPWDAEEGVSGSAVDDGARHHFVSTLTYDTIKWYVDGVLIGKTGLSPDNKISNLGTDYAYLCKSGYVADKTWMGSIHEFNIYSGVMGDAEVAANAEKFLSASDDATLSALTVDAGSLSPAFDPATYSYTVSAPYGTTSVTVTATANDAKATVEGGGIIDVSSVSDSTVTISVTAEDGTTRRTYTVEIIIGSPSDDATLSALTVDAGSLSPAFDPATYSYTVSAPYGTTSVTVTATTNDENAIIEGDGAVDVSSGSGTATIVVKAEDGTTSLTYKVTITVETTSLTDINRKGISVYPNVSAGEFIVRFSEKPGKVTVYNLTGQLVTQRRAASVNEKIRLSEPGIYLVQVESGEVVQIVKVTIVN